MVLVTERTHPAGIGTGVLPYRHGMVLNAWWDALPYPRVKRWWTQWPTPSWIRCQFIDRQWSGLRPYVRFAPTADVNR